jgi:hypothetical protein
MESVVDVALNGGLPHDSVPDRAAELARLKEDHRKMRGLNLGVRL